LTDAAKVPVLLYTGDVARLLGWRSERAHDWMIKNGVAAKAPNGRYYTTPTKLIEAFPDVFQRLLFETGSGSEG
jgi:hypothetical protein